MPGCQSALFVLCRCILLFISIRFINAIPTHEWFTFPITDPSNEATQQIISDAIQQLSQNGVFHIKNFLSPFAIESIQLELADILESQGISELSYKSRKTKSNLFSDNGDDSFSKRHPRNIKLPLSLTGVPRYLMADSMVDLYLYPPLIDLFKTVLISTQHQLPLCDAWKFDCKQWKDLHIGSTKESTSVYLQVLLDGDYGNYHFVDEGFTCSFVINEAEIGGDFMYKFVAPKIAIIKENVEWNWNLIKKVINDRIEVNSFVPKAADLYCFKGNITLHRIDSVEGDDTRIDLVMNYYDENPALTKPVEEIFYHEL